MVILFSDQGAALFGKLMDLVQTRLTWKAMETFDCKQIDVPFGEHIPATTALYICRLMMEGKLL